MARFLLRGGLVALLVGALFHRRPGWARPMLTLGLLTLLAGLLGRANSPEGFRLELVTEETLLLCAGWGAALLAFLNREKGSEGISLGGGTGTGGGTGGSTGIGGTGTGGGTGIGGGTSTGGDTGGSTGTGGETGSRRDLGISCGTASGGGLVCGLVCCLVPACVIGLALPWPDGALDLKVQHVSAPLFFLFEAVGCLLFSLASLLAWEALGNEGRGDGGEVGRLDDGPSSTERRMDRLNHGAASQDRLMDRVLFWGFVAFSTCQAVGAYWAWAGWSAPFHWNDRHLLSAAVWCFYAAALHFRFTSWPRQLRHRLLAASMIPLLFLQLIPDLLRTWKHWTGGAS